MFSLYYICIRGTVENKKKLHGVEDALCISPQCVECEAFVAKEVEDRLKEFCSSTHLFPQMLTNTTTWVAQKIYHNSLAFIYQ